MAWVKAVPSEQTKTGPPMRTALRKSRSNKKTTMKTLTKIALALLATALAARAEWVNGYTRSNGTYVAPHVRTPANRTVTENLSSRGYGTIRNSERITSKV